MLSKQRIVSILKNREIDITVSFYKKADQLLLYETETPLLESASASNLYSDRLKLTMGPIAKIINKKRVNRKFVFKNTVDCIDLRKCNNRYIIAPGESIIILTNESIKLNGKYACLIIPRISLSDVGIVVTSAYIDPYYQGVMRLQLSNLSNKPYELNSLEAVAQCFFFELNEEVSIEYKDSFSTKSVFYGQTWAEIINSDRPPFPTKKNSTENNHFSHLRYQGDLIFQFLKKHSIIFFLLTNLFVIISGYAVLKQDYIHYKETVMQIENWLEPISSEIIVDPNNPYAKKEIIIDIPKADIITVLCNNEDIHFELLSGNTANETIIIFSYDGPFDDQIMREIDFTYIVVRRIS